MADIIDKAIEAQITNKLIQASSSNLMTHYEFAKTYLKKLKRDESLVSPGEWDFPLSQSSISSSFDGSMKFHLTTNVLENELGISLPTIEEMIDRYITEMQKV